MQPIERGTIEKSLAGLVEREKFKIDAFHSHFVTMTRISDGTRIQVHARYVETRPPEQKGYRIKDPNFEIFHVFPRPALAEGGEDMSVYVDDTIDLDRLIEECKERARAAAQSKKAALRN